MKVLVPLAGLIDRDAELKRLDKEIDARSQDLARVQGKLGNENFTARAPAAVVDKERRRAGELEAALRNLRDQHKRIAALN
jgi:valyl-tRNA synthetase